MRIKLPALALLLVIAFASCQKMGVLKSRSNELTSELVVPKGFIWESSRNIKVKVSITDQGTTASPYLIELYDQDPALGGSAITKGAATLKMPFETAIYLSNEISTIYIVKIAPNNTQVILKVAPGNSDVDVSMGAPLVPATTGIKMIHPGIKS